ncbi:hypothetical protein M8494_03865 [Serratia ureilytica]
MIRSARDGDIGAVFGIGFRAVPRRPVPLYGRAWRRESGEDAGLPPPAARRVFSPRANRLQAHGAAGRALYPPGKERGRPDLH